MKTSITKYSAIAVLLAALAAVAATTAPATPPSNADLQQHAALLEASLPADGGFTVLVEKPFVIVGNAPAAEVKDSSAKIVRWTVDHLHKDFFDKDPDGIIDIYLLKDKDTYNQYSKTLLDETPDTPYGFFSGAHRAIVVNISTGGGTLVHEIVHPYIAANFPQCPPWFNEGLASLYEQSEEKNGHIWGLPNWRLEGLKAALSGTGADGPAPAFKALCAMNAATFYGKGRGPNYAVARYLCMYLQEKGVLPQFYKDFVKNQEKDPTGYDTLQATLRGLGETDMDAFRKKWEAWAMAMKYP